VEVLNPSLPRGGYRAAVFDFDGTVSLLREGWAGIMAGMGLERLPAGAVSAAALEDQMLRLSGMPSIFQMRKLSEVVAAHTGAAPDPDGLLQEFLRRLLAVSGERCDDVAAGRVPPEAWTVPGTHALLADLRRRGVALYLASGTDLAFVKREAELLGLTEFFGDRVYGPTEGGPEFTKRAVVAAVVREHGGGLLGFGDGYAETVEVKAAGGTMVGVASREPGVPGANPLKRAMLAELGADVIVADYRDGAGLVAWLFGEG
jgi:phosphoglycolate phosphatase